jgi:uncharacterized protein (TIGR03437 family)
MPAARLLLLAACLFVRPRGAGQEPFVPAYSPSTIVNAASQTSGLLAPNAIATLYGSDLAYVTRGLVAGDIRGGTLPTVLSGSGVRVLLSGQPAFPYFVSPRQVNFLVPSNLKPGLFRLQLVREGRAGPEVEVRLGAAAPGLFQYEPGLAIAVRLNGALVSRESPASPGDVLILYATGLGETVPPPRAGEIAQAAAPLAATAGFELHFDGNRVAPGDVLYVGLAPGFAGLYQINVRLPQGVGQNPEVRVAAGGVFSAEAVRLPVR